MESGMSSESLTCTTGTGTSDISNHGSTTATASNANSDDDMEALNDIEAAPSLIERFPLIFNVKPHEKQEISLSLIVKRGCPELYKPKNPNNKMSIHEYASHDDMADAVLGLSHVRLDRENIDVIDNLECLNKVTHLYLQHNTIKKIENLDYLPSLVFLALFNNNISKVEGLTELRNLRLLDLSSNNISTIDSDQFPKSLSFLNLMDNPCAELPEFCQDIIRALPSLKELNNNTVTIGQRKRLDDSDVEDSSTDEANVDDSDELRENDQSNHRSNEHITADHQKKMEDIISVVKATSRVASDRVRQRMREMRVAHSQRMASTRSSVAEKFLHVYAPADYNPETITVRDSENMINV